MNIKGLDQTVAKSGANAITPERRYKNRRRALRRYVRTPVHFMTAAGWKGHAVMTDISECGLRLDSDLKPALGVDVTMTLVDIGTLVGRVVRHDDLGMALTYDIGPGKWAELEKSIIALAAQRLQLPSSSDRRHGDRERRTFKREWGGFASISGRATDGVPFECRVINYAYGGVRVVTDGNLRVGDVVHIGTDVGQVVWADNNQFGIKLFKSPTPVTPDGEPS